MYTSLVEKGAGRERVRAMTKSVNIFEKDFIFIPINKVRPLINVYFCNNMLIASSSQGIGLSRVLLGPE